MELSRGLPQSRTGWPERRAFPDMTRALFVTEFPISPDDHDQSLDVYLHTPQKRARFDQPDRPKPEIRNPTSVHLQGSARLGIPGRLTAPMTSVITFDSEQQLVPGQRFDVDVYARIGDETRLVSTGPNPDRNSRKAKLLGVSNDGTTISFSTPNRCFRSTPTVAWTSTPTRPAGFRALVMPPSASRKRRVVVLVSAESDAPRMKVLGKPSFQVAGPWSSCVARSPDDRSCRTDSADPVSAAAARGAARFQVKPGRSVRSRREAEPSSCGRQGRAQVRIKTWDRLGNTYRAVRKLSFR